MKNKKGFTLVELLAVIVILALITGIAVISIGNVLSDARESAMWESAQGAIDGVRKVLAIKMEDTEGRAYGFNSTAFESGGATLKDVAIKYRTMTTSGTNPDVEISTGIWRIGSTAPTTCTTTTGSYVSVTGGVYKICLINTEGVGIFGDQNQIATRAAAAKVGW